MATTSEMFLKLVLNNSFSSNLFVIELNVYQTLFIRKRISPLNSKILTPKSFLILLANKIHAKSNTSKEIINQKPEFRILAFLNSHKRKSECNGQKVLIPYTHQEIANFTGLRVETVIRVFSKMNENKKVEIINHKIFF